MRNTQTLDAPSDQGNIFDIEALLASVGENRDEEIDPFAGLPAYFGDLFVSTVPGAAVLSGAVPDTDTAETAAETAEARPAAPSALSAAEVRALRGPLSHDLRSDRMARRAFDAYRVHCGGLGVADIARTLAYRPGVVDAAGVTRTLTSAESKGEWLGRVFAVWEGDAETRRLLAARAVPATGEEALLLVGGPLRSGRDGASEAVPAPEEGGAPAATVASGMTAGPKEPEPAVRPTGADEAAPARTAPDAAPAPQPPSESEVEVLRAPLDRDLRSDRMARKAFGSYAAYHGGESVVDIVRTLAYQVKVLDEDGATRTLRSVASRSEWLDRVIAGWEGDAEARRVLADRGLDPATATGWRLDPRALTEVEVEVLRGPLARDLRSDRMARRAFDAYRARRSGLGTGEVARTLLYFPTVVDEDGATRTLRSVEQKKAWLERVFAVWEEDARTRGVLAARGGPSTGGSGDDAPRAGGPAPEDPAPEYPAPATEQDTLNSVFAGALLPSDDSD